MKTLLKGAKVFDNKGKGQFIKKDLLVDSEKVIEIGRAHV